jgi:hypothetical protein
MDAEDGGVPLAQFAAVTAALAEGFPLDAVLAVEELDAERWAAADLAWTAQLAGGGEALARYEAALASAEDRLARRVAPIEDDLGAWLAFLDASSRAKDPAAFLAGHGLGTNDLARLGRRWRRRMSADRALEKRAADLRRQGPGALPPLRVGNAKLVPSGAGRRKEAAPAAAGAAEGAPPIPLDRYAALCAELTMPKADEARVLAKYGVAKADRAAIDGAFRDRFARDHGEARDFVRLVAHHRARASLAAAGGPAPLPEAPLAIPAPAVEPGTLVADAVAGITLPFGASPSLEFLLALAQAPAQEGSGSDGGTVVAQPSPFAAPPVDAPEIEAPEDEAPEDEVFDEKTTLVMRSPFTEAAVPETIAAMVSPLAPAAALPFAPARPSPPQAPQPPAPPLPLERHASLCVELALDPAHPAEVLARYQITQAERERADAYWRARIAQDPAARAAWNQAFELYRAWITAQRAP